VQAYLSNAAASSQASRIEYIVHSQNLNGAAARNTGIMASTGEYVCFLDDDDQYLPGRLSEVVGALQGEKKSFGGVYCGFLGWNSPENDLDRYPEEDLSKKLISLDYRQHYLHTNTVTYRFSELIKTNGFDESYPRHQDLEFNLRFLSVSSLGAVKKPLVRLNPRPSSQDNRIFGFRLFEIKQKFLAEFSELIASFGLSEANRIYKAHCDEVIRYNSDNNEFPVQILESNNFDFALITYARLNKPLEIERFEERVEQGENVRELENRIDALKAELVLKKRELEDARKSLSYRIAALWRSITKDQYL
jgi:glycosyltransferase involved in cell wall biosynthesis